ncbi:MAG: hypothetical protein KBD17_01145 [Candidatus Pacebacteria bacterium]|nr:hypothetical protein [Candidatus Paceibacterota bacterium]
MKNYNKKNRGFVALITSVIISTVLLMVATNLSLTGFYARSNLLDFELKEMSYHLAEACIDTAILKIINNPNYNPTNESVDINEYKCAIESITGNIIKTKADYRNYITNLEVEINPSDMSIVRFEEK